MGVRIAVSAEIFSFCKNAFGIFGDIEEKSAAWRSDSAGCALFSAVHCVETLITNLPLIFIDMFSPKSPFVCTVKVA